MKTGWKKKRGKREKLCCAVGGGRENDDQNWWPIWDLRLLASKKKKRGKKISAIEGNMNQLNKIDRTRRGRTQKKGE